MRERLSWSGLALGSALLGLAAGCGGAADVPAATGGVEPVRGPDGTIIDDRSLCDWKARKDRETSETAAVGAIYPNVRRVWQVYGSGADRRKVLVCREIDTNLDGVKDVVRRYNDEGQSKEELADRNYDGKLDTWIVFAKGRLAEVRIDRNHDGEPDEWKTYAEGKLVRIKRDTNFDKQPDVWEMYQRGKLVRSGVDVDHDTRVDRWDHDTEWRRKLEQAERTKEEEERARREREAKEAGAKALDEDPGGEAGGTAPAPTPKSEPKTKPPSEPYAEGG